MPIYLINVKSFHKRAYKIEKMPSKIKRLQFQMSKTILKSGFVLERKEIKNERKLESYALQISSYRCIYLMTCWRN